jgi:hypothetical protein
LIENDLRNEEMKTGVPVPHKYDHYVINKYSFPKGLITGEKIRSENLKRDDRKLLINPKEQRKGITGWKLSKNKPLKTVKMIKTYQLGKRSKSTKPTEDNTEQKYETEAERLYESSSNNIMSLIENNSFQTSNNTIEYADQRLLKNEKLNFLSDTQIVMPSKSKQLGKIFIVICK